MFRKKKPVENKFADNRNHLAPAPANAPPADESDDDLVARMIETGLTAFPAGFKPPEEQRVKPEHKPLDQPPFL